MGVLNNIYRLFGKLIFTCAVFATITLILLMLVNVLDVIMRWFGNPIYGVYELNSLLVGINIFLGLAYVQNAKKHMMVDVLQKRGPLLFQKFTSIFPYLLGTIFFGWLGFIYAGEAIESFQAREVMSGLVKFPMYLLKIIMASGIILLTIQYFFDFIYAIVNPKKLENESELNIEDKVHQSL